MLASAKAFADTLDLNGFDISIKEARKFHWCPKHIEKFAELAGLPVEEFSSQSFYCGDGARDMEIAKMFNIYAVGVAQTVSKEKLFQVGADVAVDRIGEVIELEILK